MRFAKYEGLGNDFVLIDRDDLPGRTLSAELARTLCDRHRGIGADGALVVTNDAAARAGGSPPIEGAYLSMDVVNADGSTSEMCGNGLRCVALFAALRGWIDGTHALVRTGAGPLACTLLPDGEVEVDMGRVETQRALIPMLGDGDPIDVSIDVAGRIVRVSACALGNPHAVTFDGIPAGEHAIVGPALEHHPLFPARVNVGFASVRRDAGSSAEAGASIDLAVWERGVGLTQACGTGACAAAVAAVRTGRASAEHPITVRLPGGTLRITVAADLSRVLMRGPARHVFSGDIEVSGPSPAEPSSVERRP